MPGAGPQRQLQRLQVRVCVPWRSSPERAPIWAYVRERWERLGWPIFEGDAGGDDFNRSAARNAAADGPWDVAVFVDADTVMLDTGPVSEAVWRALDGPAVLPHDRYVALSKRGTMRVLAGTERGFRNLTKEKANVPLGVIVVGRAAWDEVGGFDERFHGWGGEDVAFRVACSTLPGLERIPGTLHHLWHPIDPTKRAYIASRGGELRQLYREAQNQPARMRELLAGAREREVA